MRRASALACAAAAAALGLAACGGGGDNSTTAASTPSATATSKTGPVAGASTVNISTPSGGELAYEQKDVSAKAGNVTIEFQNNEAIPHDVAVEDSSGKQLGVTDLIASGSSSATVDLIAGTYTFFCTVPGHRDAGMEGTLTVK